MVNSHSGVKPYAGSEGLTHLKRKRCTRRHRKHTELEQRKRSRGVETKEGAKVAWGQGEGDTYDAAPKVRLECFLLQDWES